MKHFSMTDRKDTPVRPASKQSRRTDAAFDIWLNRGLQALYGKVVEEPLPPELLKLIEDDRGK